MGAPGRIIRSLTPEEIEKQKQVPRHYVGAGAKGHGKRAGVILLFLLFFFFGFFPVLIFFILIAYRGIVVLVVDAGPTP